MLTEVMEYKPKKEDGEMSWSKVGLFALGTLFGSAGIRVLSSRDAKKVYTHCNPMYEKLQNLYKGKFGHSKKVHESGKT